MYNTWNRPRSLWRKDKHENPQTILLLCWLTYTLAYTLRVNIAVVIPVLIIERGYTFTQMGTVTTLYFISYMLGQLINGYIGDRIQSKFLIICGLILSVLCNTGMAITPVYSAMLIVWAINGFAQSMLWAPIMKTLSVWHAGYQLERVSFTMATSMIIGYALSWGFSSVIMTYAGWKYAFIIPAIVMTLHVIILFIFFRSRPSIPVSEIISGQQADPEQLPEQTIDSDKPVERLPLRDFVRQIRLPGLLMIALTQGIIREGISIWFPSIIESSTYLPAQSTWLILIIVPAVNFSGILFVRSINRHHNGDSTKTLLVVFALVTITALLLNLFLIQWFWIIITIMILLLALTYGLTPILTSVIPFQYVQFKRVSLTAGIIDFSIYTGAALSGLVSGYIADRFSWNGVMLLWLGAAAAGLLISTHRYIITYRKVAP